MPFWKNFDLDFRVDAEARASRSGNVEYVATGGFNAKEPKVPFGVAGVEIELGGLFEARAPFDRSRCAWTPFTGNAGFRGRTSVETVWPWYLLYFRGKLEVAANGTVGLRSLSPIAFAPGKAGLELTIEAAIGAGKWHAISVEGVATGGADVTLYPRLDGTFTALASGQAVVKFLNIRTRVDFVSCRYVYSERRGSCTVNWDRPISIGRGRAWGGSRSGALLT